MRPSTILVLLMVSVSCCFGQRPVRSIYRGTLISRRRVKTLTNHQYTASRGNGRYNVFGSVPQRVRHFPADEQPYFTTYHHPFSTNVDDGYPGMREQWMQSSPFFLYTGQQYGYKKEGTYGPTSTVNMNSAKAPFMINKASSNQLIKSVTIPLPNIRISLNGNSKLSSALKKVYNFNTSS